MVTALGHVATTAAAAAAGIAVAHVHPDGPVVSQRAPHLAEHRNQIVDEFTRRGLQAKLAVDPIVAQTELGRAGDAGMHRLVRQRPHHVDAVAYQDAMLLGHGVVLACRRRPRLGGVIR